MELILILGLIYLFYSSGALANLGIGSPVVPAPAGVPALQPVTTSDTIPVIEAAAPQPYLTLPSACGNQPVSGTSVLGAVMGGINVGANAAMTGGPIAAAGATAGAIFGSLWQGHQLRMAQAKDENSATNIGVAGFDSDIRLVNAQYNAGMIDVQTAILALQQTFVQYWIITNKYIQPGRNGCCSGATCQGAQSVLQSGKQPCTGDIGAACCIGCAPLYYSLYAQGSEVGIDPSGGIGAITVLAQGGNRASTVFTVYGSSYGAQTRNSYTLQWKPMGA